ncbi:MAG: class I SAM-dependent methyltransferase [Candidatus Eisenbacteria bacterium]
MARRTASPPTTKTYDRDYFDRWYRDPAQAVILGSHLERRVRLAVAAAEYVLEREVETVLDVGCGEAPWRAILKRLRPRARYAGLDPSAYAVARDGKRRGIALAGVGDLGTQAVSAALERLGARPPYDLVVCSDVLHYVPTPDLVRGLRVIGRWVQGVAFLEFFTRGDDTEGDTESFEPRSAATYARLLRAAGLTHLGLHCYAGRRVERAIMTFERGFAAPPPRGG